MKRLPSRYLPTVRMLDSMGTDAVPVMEAIIAELERGIPLARSQFDRERLTKDLRRANSRLDEYLEDDRCQRGAA